jgi:hypothetical protein
MALFFVFSTGYLIGYLLCVGLAASTIQEAVAHGQRTALKSAIEVVKDRSETSVQLAPEGRLDLGLVRGRAADQIEMDLRALLAGVK